MHGILPFPKSYPEKWMHLINRKVQANKIFWQVILHNYLATHCVGFSLKSKATNFFPKHILKLTALDQSIQSKNKFNVLCKVLIKIESTWRRESKNRPFSWLYCTVVGLSKAAVLGDLQKTDLKNLAISTGSTCVRVFFKSSWTDTNTVVFL